MLRENLYKLVNHYYVLKGNENTYSILNELKNMKDKDRKYVEEIVHKKLANVLNHAGKEVRYYKKSFVEAGFDACGFRSRDEMDKLPVLTKSIIRGHFPDEIISPRMMSRAIYNTTSGSTGQPLEFYNDVHANPYRSSSYMFFNTMMGVPPLAIHWNVKSTGKTNLRQKFNNWVQGKNLYSVMDVNKDNVRAITQQINLLKPTYIEGYTGSLVRLAGLMKSEDVHVYNRPRAVIATSETLTETGRKLVTEELGGEVYNRYGSREFSGAVAQECTEHDEFHINPLLTYVEIVDDDGLNVSEGEKGKVLVTDLNNMVMPFIRYDIGDMAVKGSGDCPCGLPFDSIKTIQGRSGEFIVDSNNENIPFITISAYLFRRHYAPHVYSYQFQQRKPGEITLLVVPSPRFTEETRNEISQTLKELLPGFITELHIVDDIPPEPTGKTPFLKRP